MQRIALVVDDSRVARMTLKKLLGTYQFDVVELSSGEEAIDYLLADHARPDIVFMDVMMGGMDGLAATQTIKSNPELSNIPIIICTGNDTAEDKTKALNVGAVTALTKPPGAEALEKVLAQVENTSIASTTMKSESVAEQIDEAAIVASVLATIETTLLPKINQNVREIAEDISQQIAGDMAENLVEEQVNSQLKKMVAELSMELMSKTETIAEKTAQQACAEIVQESVMDVASQAVQTVVDEASIPVQVEQFLEKKGEEWLEEQEEDLGSQLSTQLGYLIPSRCTEFLEKNLTDSVLSIMNEHQPAVIESTVDNDAPSRSDIEAMISVSLHDHTSTVVNPIVSSVVSKQVAAQTLLEQDEDAIDSLTEKVSLLQNITVGLGLVVAGLLIAIIV